MGINQKALQKSIDSHTKRKKEMEDRKNRVNTNWLKLVSGENYIKLLPPHENMNGTPWIHRRMHWQLGPDENLPAVCLRDDEKQPLDDCEACKESYTLFKAGNKDRSSAIRVKPR